MSKARIIGELVLVAYKAKDLPNRELVGKQDPFVVIRLGENTRKTRTDYRGGQHPIWDDQINIPVPEKKNMIVVQVYDEDSKREDLISETEVDITKVLEDGEWDSWHPLTYKGRSAGEIYLEMTFYSARPPPKRQPTRFGNKKKKPVSGGYAPPIPQQHQRPPQQMMQQQYPPSGRPAPVPIESTSTPTYGSVYPPQQNPRPLHPQQAGINSTLPPPVPTPSISTGSNHMYPPQGRPQGTSRPASYNGSYAQPPNSNYGQNPATGHAPLLSSSYNPTPRPHYGGGNPNFNNSAYPPQQQPYPPQQQPYPPQQQPFQGGGYPPAPYPPVQGGYPPHSTPQQTPQQTPQFGFPEPQQFPSGYRPYADQGGAPFAAHQGNFNGYH